MSVASTYHELSRRAGAPPRGSRAESVAGVDESAASGSGTRRVVRRRRRVLLVEDEGMVRRALERMLRRMEFEVHSAASASEGVEVFLSLDGDASEGGDKSAGGIDLLVTDLMMPAGGGLHLAGRLRKDLPELPVIFVSGFSDPDTDGWDEARCRFLTKPFRAEQLEQVIGALVPRASRPSAKERS